ncbi:zinc finger protein with KRAB and SCAN domains 2-like isoform X1 [Mauremys reevesii]|uniref:zinc finger protein with KRAB and SCAN domains 2-like isoform X1 n=1 Tax=Mauremys reevesii TaxID=260615 RepID=UPI00193EF44E|nr:zinc finger protein with KRAB and SCAN domains 2-like isoform X1 [Mauremys reevesii]XP_039358233.1 zinc finger protein with KRAB and SCAN domains 2-like isoform X1 [Mauremys reevesii]
MRGPRAKRSPAWSRQEMLDLLGLWGEEAVQAQLQSSRRNAEVYEKISQGMVEKGYQRDLLQCRVKAKELRLAYQKAREANGHSGAALQTCPFYKELHAILCNDPTPKKESSEESESQGSGELELLDEEEEETNGRQASGGSVVPGRQELFVTPEQSSQLQHCSMADRDAGEGTSARSAAWGSPSTPSAGLFQIRRRPKRTRDDVPHETMNASGRAHTEPRTAVSETMDVMSRAQTKETERHMQQEVLGILKEQTDILRRLLDLQERYFKSQLPLRLLQNNTLTSPYFPSPPRTHSTWRRDPMQYPFCSVPGEGAWNPSRPFTDV